MPWIDVTDVKVHLNKSETDVIDDDELEGFREAACAAIEARMGHVDVLTLIEDVVPGYRGLVILADRPVVDVDAVALLRGGSMLTELDRADLAAGTAGWQLTSSGGVVTVPASSGPVRVTYRVGREPVPENFRLAALELVAHLWRASQLNGSSGRDRMSRFGDNNQVIVPGLANALPYRVRELLGLDGKQLSDSVLIG